MKGANHKRSEVTPGAGPIGHDPHDMTSGSLHCTIDARLESLLMQPQTAVSANLGLVWCGVAPGVDQQLLADQQLQLFCLATLGRPSGLYRDLTLKMSMGLS